MKNFPEFTNTTHSDKNGRRPSGSKAWPWHTSSLALSMLFFLSIISALLMLTLLWNFSISYQNRAILIEMYINQSSQTKTAISPFPIDFNVTTTNELRTSLRTSPETEIPTTSLPETTIPENPIIILNEKSSHYKKYSCAKVCDAPSIFSARLNITLSANGQNYLILETSVQTEDKRIAKRRVAYEAIRHIHKEYLKISATDPEWDLPVLCNTSANKTIWIDNCR